MANPPTLCRLRYVLGYGKKKTITHLIIIDTLTTIRSCLFGHFKNLIKISNLENQIHLLPLLLSDYCYFLHGIVHHSRNDRIIKQKQKTNVFILRIINQSVTCRYDSSSTSTSR